MDNKLPCEIVGDLLPSYVDGLTSEATNEAVENHIRGCESCALMVKRMRAPEEIKEPQGAEIDYLKKTRKRFSLAALIFAIVAVVIVTLGFLIRFYNVGNEVSPSVIDYTVSVQGNKISFKGSLRDSGSGYSRLSFKEEEGVVTIKVYGAPKAFFNGADFSSEYSAQDTIKEIRIGNMVIWDSGVEISRNTAAVYAAKNPYVGNMSGNGRVASALAIPDRIGGFTNEIQTDKEPYGWKMILSDDVDANKEAALRELMRTNSYVILAAIDNLGYVTWEYKTPSGIQSLTISKEDASAYVGENIKDFSKTPAKLQKLMESLLLD